MPQFDVTEIGVLQAADPVDYLRDLAQHQQQPGLVIEYAPLAAAMEQLGAKSIALADPFEPYQMCLPLYIGVTTPRATTEVPHWHPDQAEAYVMVDGEAEVLCKYRWEDNGWMRRFAKAGDMVVVQPEVCHWFRWRSARGLALVFKAPQRPGVGRFPAGKTVCQFCPHHQRGCVLPEGFTPPEDARR